jgi:hypothetical protein
MYTKCSFVKYLNTKVHNVLEIYLMEFFINLYFKLGQFTLLSLSKIHVTFILNIIYV